jgi:hypothetical protein
MNDRSSLSAADQATGPATGEAHPEPGHTASPAGAIAIGQLVITWDDEDPREYGGPSDHPGLTEVSFALTERRTPVIKCDPRQVAPADTPIPARDARVTVEQRDRSERPYGAAGNWRLTLPGQLPSWHKTKRDGTAAGLRQIAILDWHEQDAPAAPADLPTMLDALAANGNLIIAHIGAPDSQAADAAPAEVLIPYTVAAGTTRAYRVCWINLEALEPGTAAFTDEAQGLVVCAACAAHCTSCTDPDCDHPRYVYAAPVSGADR